MAKKKAEEQAQEIDYVAELKLHELASAAKFARDTRHNTDISVKLMAEWIDKKYGDGESQRNDIFRFALEDAARGASTEGGNVTDKGIYGAQNTYARIYESAWEEATIDQRVTYVLEATGNKSNYLSDMAQKYAGKKVADLKPESKEEAQGLKAVLGLLNDLKDHRREQLIFRRADSDMKDQLKNIDEAYKQALEASGE